MCAWKVFGDDFESGELENTNKFQTTKFGYDTILRAVRTWIIVVGDPTFTDLHMKMYSNQLIGSDNSPNVLIATSTNTLTKSEIITLENGVKEIYFEFDYIPCNGETLYNFVINGTGYTSPTTTSHIAWRKAFPDPVYTSGYTPAMETVPYSPYALYIIGANV